MACIIVGQHSPRSSYPPVCFYFRSPTRYEDLEKTGSLTALERPSTSTDEIKAEAAALETSAAESRERVPSVETPIDSNGVGANSNSNGHELKGERGRQFVTSSHSSSSIGVDGRKRDGQNSGYSVVAGALSSSNLGGQTGVTSSQELGRGGGEGGEKKSVYEDCVRVGEEKETAGQEGEWTEGIDVDIAEEVNKYVGGVVLARARTRSSRCASEVSRSRAGTIAGEAGEEEAKGVPPELVEEEDTEVGEVEAFLYTPYIFVCTVCALQSIYVGVRSDKLWHVLSPVRSLGRGLSKTNRIKNKLPQMFMPFEPSLFCGEAITRKCGSCLDVFSRPCDSVDSCRYGAVNKMGPSRRSQ